MLNKLEDSPSLPFCFPEFLGYFSIGSILRRQGCVLQAVAYFILRRLQNSERLFELSFYVNFLFFSRKKLIPVRPEKSRKTGQQDQDLRPAREDPP